MTRFTAFTLNFTLPKSLTDELTETLNHAVTIKIETISGMISKSAMLLFCAYSLETK